MLAVPKAPLHLFGHQNTCMTEKLGRSLGRVLRRNLERSLGEGRGT